MAVGITERGTGRFSYGADGPTDIGNAFTPVTDTVVAVFAEFTSSSDSVSSVTGWSGQTFSQVGEEVGTDVKIELWARRITGSPGSGQPNATVSNNYAANFAVLELTGCSTSGAVTSIFVNRVDNNENSFYISSEWVIGTQGSYGSSGNAMVAMCGVRNTTSAWTFTTPTGYDGQIDFNDEINVVYNLGDDDLTPSIAFSGSSTSEWITGLAYEVEEESIASGSTPKGVFGRALHGPLGGGAVYSFSKSLARRPVWARRESGIIVPKRLAA